MVLYYGPRNLLRFDKGVLADVYARYRTAISSTLTVVGMSFWWPLLRTSITGIVFEGQSLCGQQALNLFGILSLACLVAVGFASPFARRGTVQKVSTVCMATVASASALALLLDCSNALAVASGIISFASVYVLLPLAWAGTLVHQNRTDLNRCFALVIGSYIASYVPDYLVFLVPAIETARPVFSLAASAVLWMVAEYLIASPNTVAPSSKSESRFYPETTDGQIPPSFLAFLLLFYLINCLVVGFVRTGTFEYHADSLLLARVSASVVVASSLLLITSFPRRSNLEKRSARAASVLILLSALLLIGLLIASLLPKRRAFDIGAGLIAATSSCTSVFLYSFAVITMERKKHPARYLTFAFTLPVLINVLIGIFAIPALEAAADMDSYDFWGMPSLVSGLFLAIVLIALLGVLFVKSIRYALESRDSNIGREALPFDPEKSPSIQSTRPFETFGLSHREQELVELLMHGHTFKKAAELLRLSEGTVQTYAKKIYRKTGVHSKQELIDLIQQIDAAPRTGVHTREELVERMHKPDSGDAPHPARTTAGRS